MNKFHFLILAALSITQVVTVKITHAREVKQPEQQVKLGIYRHFKGGMYQVIGFARHSETLEKLVVYQALYKNYGIWVRPINMFTEEVMYHGAIVPRFSYIGKGHTQIPKLK